MFLFERSQLFSESLFLWVFVGSFLLLYLRFQSFGAGLLLGQFFTQKVRRLLWPFLFDRFIFGLWLIFNFGRFGCLVLHFGRFFGSFLDWLFGRFFGDRLLLSRRWRNHVFVRRWLSGNLV